MHNKVNNNDSSNIYYISKVETKSKFGCDLYVDLHWYVGNDAHPQVEEIQTI